MEIVIALVAAGLGAWAWRRRSPRGERAIAAFDGDAEVALAVAAHDARSRGHALGGLHVLYGLLQDATVIAAIERIGGDAAKLEDRVLDALARADASAAGDAPRVLGRAVAIARALGRPARCADLWGSLLAHGVLAICAEAGVRAVDVLFVLAHGCAPPDATALAGPIDIVLRNDDFTTRDLVVAILRDVFELDDARATEVMLQAHHSGHALVGRLPAALARARIESAHRRARDAGFPLWIDARPV